MSKENLIDGKWVDEVWAACAREYELMHGEPATSQDFFLNMVRQCYQDPNARAVLGIKEH